MPADCRTYLCDGPGVLKILTIILGIFTIGMTAGTFAISHKTALAFSETFKDTNTNATGDPFEGGSDETYYTEHIILEILTGCAVIFMIIISTIWIPVYLCIRTAKIRKILDVLIHVLGGFLLIGGVVAWCLSLMERIIPQEKWNDNKTRDEIILKMQKFGTKNLIFFDWSLKALRQQSRTVEGIRVEHTNDRTRFALVTINGIFLALNALLYLGLGVYAIFSKDSIISLPTSKVAPEPQKEVKGKEGSGGKDKKRKKSKKNAGGPTEANSKNTIQSSASTVAPVPAPVPVVEESEKHKKGTSKKSGGETLLEAPKVQEQESKAAKDDGQGHGHGHAHAPQTVEVQPTAQAPNPSDHENQTTSPPQENSANSN